MVKDFLNNKFLRIIPTIKSERDRSPEKRRLEPISHAKKENLIRKMQS